MARYRYLSRRLRRLRRRLRRHPGWSAAAAVAAGMVLAVIAAGHSGHGAAAASGGASAAAAITSDTSNQALGNRMAMSGYGWAGAETTCLDDLWQRESGWSQYADTRVTGLDAPDAAVFAYGIAQARPYSKMPQAGWPADEGGDSDTAVQITWGLGYISATYGTPCAAWAHEEADGWY
jgi:hypothetical protein